MSSTTDTQLREIAEKNLADAQGILGLPAVVVGWDVTGDDYWDGLATRAKGTLDKARKATGKVAADAARKVRDAARAGINSASEASDAAKGKLGAIAATAGMLALGPGILLGLIVLAVVEGSGWGGKVRRAGRRYVSKRAADYGVY